MAEHADRATIARRRRNEDSAKERDSRAHERRCDAGVKLPASASPSVVPKPRCRDDAVDPETAFVAASSSGYTPTVVDIARRAWLVIDAFRVETVGTRDRIGPGRMAITRARLQPRIAFSGAARKGETPRKLRRQAHATSFIANSVAAIERADLQGN